MSNAVAQPVQPRSKGRPRKAAAEVRTVHVGFWLTPAEEAIMQARVSEAGMTNVSEFARAASLGVPVRPRRNTGYSPEVVTQLRRIGNNLNQCLREARFGNFPPQVADAAEEAIRDVSKVLRAMFHGPER